MPTFKDGRELQALVMADGLARLAPAYDESGAESMHVLFLENGIPRSMLASDWPGALPKPPSQAEITKALQERQAGQEAARQARQTTRARILALLQSAAGKSAIPGQPNSITAAERAALSLAQQYMAGMLSAGGDVKDPALWFRDPAD